MTFRIGSNIFSLKAQRRLATASDRGAEIYTRLSSGQRINRAADDAAGLAISTSLRSSSRVFTQGIRNLNDAISVTNLAEGALQELTGITIRISELAEQSANGTFGVTQKRAIQAEADALVSEWNRISASTKFNGVNVLSASFHAQGGVGSEAALKVETQGLTHTEGMGPFTQIGSDFASTEAFDIKAGDINNDGKADVVVTNANTSTFSVFIGNGDGTLRAPTSYDSNGDHGLVLADVSGDGKLDVITTRYGGGIQVSLGNGNGTFRAERGYDGSTGTGLVYAQAFDFDGDGDLDILAARESGTAVEANNTFALFMNNGNGTFSYGVSYGAMAQFGYHQFFNIADINQDGKADLTYVTNDSTSGSMKIMYGNGNGSFGAPTTVTAAGNFKWEGSTVGDFDRDGYQDIVASYGSGHFFFKGNGNGTFQAGVSYGGTQGYYNQLEDFNNDGYLDLLGYYGNSYEYLLGNGNGTFRAATSFTTATVDRAFALADLNNDGVDELLTADRGGNRFQLYGMSTYQTLNLKGVTLTSPELARKTLDEMKTTLEQLSLKKSQVGASNARLSYFINTLRITQENFTSAESRITDADISHESSELIRTKILQNAATAVLAQANQAPSLVLELLKR